MYVSLRICTFGILLYTYAAAAAAAAPLLFLFFRSSPVLLFFIMFTVASARYFQLINLAKHSLFLTLLS